MFGWIQAHRVGIIVGTVGAFMASLLFGAAIEQVITSPYSPAIIVNGQKIPYRDYQARYQRNVQRQEDAKEPMKPEAVQASTVQELIQETAFLQEADRYGIEATDGEVASFIQHIPAFQRDGRFDQGLYMGYVFNNLRSTPQAFEEERRKDIRRQKLFMLLSSAVKVSDGEAQVQLTRLPGKDRKELAADPEKLRAAVAQEQGNAVFQAWIQQVNGRLKVEDRLSRWQNKEG